MGLAVLPPRLKTELEALADAIVGGKDLRANEETAKHADWAEKFIPEYSEINSENVMDILKAEVGKVFATVLEHAGVFKRNSEGMKAFERFINSVETR